MISITETEVKEEMAYLTEQQIHPLPTSIHSVTSWPPSFTVKGFSMSVAI
jgi:hypothetical protein